MGGAEEPSFAPDLTNLNKIAPETWNNIPLPLTEAVKIMVDELREIKRQAGVSSYNQSIMGKQINAAANVAVAECKKLGLDLTDQCNRLTRLIDAQIEKNNLFLE